MLVVVWYVLWLSVVACPLCVACCALFDKRCVFVFFVISGLMVVV